MKSKNKNIIIGALLAVVVVMAVGFAAFSTSLNINGSANITSNWNVHFDTSTSAKSNITATTGVTGAVAPTGSFASLTETSATISANLNQPGDSVKFTLTVLNTGDLAADIDTVVSGGTGTTCSGKTCTSSNGNIQFTVGEPSTSSLEAKTGKATIDVTATYVNKATNENANGETGSITITLNATQQTSSDTLHLIDGNNGSGDSE